MVEPKCGDVCWPSEVINEDCCIDYLFNKWNCSSGLLRVVNDQQGELGKWQWKTRHLADVRHKWQQRFLMQVASSQNSGDHEQVAH